MARASRFAFSPSWKLLFKDMGIDTAAITKYAGLPDDAFNRENYSLSVEEYFRFWRGIEFAAKGREVPLLLAEHMRADSFDAPVFASLCSANFNGAIKRLSHYKPLIGPMELHVDIGTNTTELTVTCYNATGPLPSSVGLCEAVFFTQLFRLGTREKIMPQSVVLQEMPVNRAQYEAYLGCQLELGERFKIAFSAEDAKRPFLTSNTAMWEFFEEKLNQKLADLTVTATMTERVRAVLVEAIPSGEGNIESVASKLAMSKRTLQRKLTQESESFKSVLQAVRTELADHYLEKSKLPLCEISFLLGFSESNSFIRAYSTWKGISPGQYRDQCH